MVCHALLQEIFPRDWTQASHTAGRFFSKPPENPKNTGVDSLSLLQDLPNPGIELGTPALQADSLSAELPGKPLMCIRNCSLHALTQNVKYRNENRILFSFIFGYFFFCNTVWIWGFLQYHWSLISGSTVFRGCCVDSCSDSIFHLDKHKVSDFLSSEVSMVFSDTFLLVLQVEGPLLVHF